MHSRLLVVLVVSSLLAFLLNGLGVRSYEFVATNEEDCRLGRRRPVRIPFTDSVHDDMDWKQRMEGALSSPGRLGHFDLLLNTFSVCFRQFVSCSLIHYLVNELLKDFVIYTCVQVTLLSIVLFFNRIQSDSNEEFLLLSMNVMA